MEYENDNGNFRGNPVLASIICFIVAAVCVGIGISMNINRNNKLEYYKDTVGTIVDYTDRQAGSDAEPMPIYEYVVDGRTYRHISNVSVMGENKLGNQTTIYYNPNNPQEALVDSSFSNWLFGLGGFFGFFCLLVWVSTSKRISSDVQQSLTGFLLGLLFTAFPICCLLLTDVNLFVRVLLGILCLAGVATLGSTFYTTFINKDARKNQMSYDEYQQKIDETVYKVENNPRFQQARGAVEKVVFWQSRIIPIICLVVFVGVAVVLILNARGHNISSGKGGKSKLTDEVLARQINCSVSDMPEYIVFERKITNKIDNLYFFEETAGLENITYSNEEYDIGETIYWIEFYGDYADMLCSMEHYVYEGTNIPANSPRYNSEGKCYLNDALVEERLGTTSYEVIEVEFKEIDGTNVVFTDENGQRHIMRSDDKLIKQYENYVPGDSYYWVAADGNGFVEKTDLYIYNAN